MGREEEIEYARENGIPVKGGTEVSPYSIDDNLWGRSSEGRTIEDLDEAAPDDVFQLVTRPEEAPDEPQVVTVGFERGRPVSLDGERLGLVELLERAAEIGERHGVGIVDHIEDRVVGLKVRDIYEVPAAAIVLAAHRELEKLVCTIHQNNFKGRTGEPVGLPLLRGALAGAPAARPRRLHGLGERVRHRRGRAEALPRLGDADQAELAVRAVRPLACIFRRIRGRVLTTREPRVHRALHHAEQAGPQNPRGEREVIYELIGRLVVWFVRWRFGRQIRIAAGAGVALTALGIAAYLATRGEDEEAPA